MNWNNFSNIIFKLLPSGIKEGLKPLLGVPSNELSLLNLKRNAVQVSTFIDIGAYKGGFSSMMISIWPESKGLMIEANPIFEPNLLSLQKSNANLSYKISLLDAKAEKSVPFYLSETASSVLKSHGGGGETLLLNTSTLDQICIEENFCTWIDLLKLDVQGFELEVLKGGQTVLQNSAIVLLEVALLDIYVDTPLVRDVINFMYDYGFILYDICSVDIKRPLDNALWQSDFIFIKKNSVLRSNKSYS